MVRGGRDKIHILPEDIVGLIAAGEVIERPAAVVKELVENSLDAGSRFVTIEVKDGGLTMIRVTDDGEGMTAGDAQLAFARHATSKLCSVRDLEAIRTMGFRGEALPSIAAVSHVRVSTALHCAETGISFQVRQGQVGPIAETAPVAGTTIEVTELFANQPARKKFLKSIATEFFHISRVVQQAALAWPSVHFRLIHNGTEVMNYPAVLSDRDRVGQVYQPSFLARCREVQAMLPMAQVTGYVIDPVYARSSRVPQELFVNRRSVRSTTIFHAVAEGYGATLPKGRHPLFVLFLEVDPSQVDVNVHPAKREVRFADQELIHHLMRRAVYRAIRGEKNREVVGETERVAQNGKSTAGEGSGALITADRLPKEQADPQKAQRTKIEGASGGQPIEQFDTPYRYGDQLSYVKETAESYTRTSRPEVTVLGQINQTFLIVRLGEDLAVLDQHTAHERVLFERLFRAWLKRDIQSQPLLIPESITVSAAHATLLGRYLGELEKLGLDIEPFGGSTILVRAVPLGVGKIDVESLVLDLLDDLSHWNQAATLEAKVRPILASLACHAAVRAGRSLEPPEIKALVEDWIAEGEQSTCPHGRRTVFRLSTEDLEKMFGRAGW
ncbi:MAG: DNA mismatch repair endonuclease MutL [Nitrospira sp.]